MVGKVFPEGDKLMVNGVDALTGQTVVIDADMVVLAAATKAKDDAVALKRKLNISTDKTTSLQRHTQNLNQLKQLQQEYIWQELVKDLKIFLRQ